MGTLAPANSQIEDTFLIKKKIDIKFGLFLKPKINPLTPFLIKRRKTTIWVGVLIFPLKMLNTKSVVQ